LCNSLIVVSFQPSVIVSVKYVSSVINGAVEV